MKKTLPNIHISTITIIFTIIFAVYGCKEKFMSKAKIINKIKIIAKTHTFHQES